MFLPRFISTGLSTIWFLGFLELIGGYFFYLGTMPFIVVIGVFVSVMLAEMVRFKEQDDFLRKSFLSTAGRWKKVIGASLVFIFTSFVISIPSSAGFLGFIYTGQPLWLLGILLSLVLIIGMSFAVYFLPISLVERSGLVDGFIDSARTSYQNSREVSLLLLLSLGLLAVAFVSQGALESIGYMGFAASRMLSAVVTTYLFVVSPSYYIEKKEDES